jgi:2-dehydro-3-deoxyphosphogluconate aldolase/(4S)-4-hydroxy-2-oxoglutarate aldolase
MRLRQSFAHLTTERTANYSRGRGVTVRTGAYRPVSRVGIRHVLPVETVAFDARLAAWRVLPVIVLSDATRAAGVGAALVAGQLPLAEVTFRTDAAEESIRAMSSIDGLCVGAGTVTSVEQVDRAVACGAQFVVCPGTFVPVVERSLELGIPVVPGVATASDLTTAMSMGLDLVKFFPAEAMGGLSTITALAAPFPSMRFLPTGGVTLESALVYLRHRAVPAVGGSWMVPPRLIDAGDWPAVLELVTATVRALSELDGAIS